MQYILSFAVDTLALLLSCVLAWFIFDYKFHLVLPDEFSKSIYYVLLFVAFVLSFFTFNQTKNITKRKIEDEIFLALSFNVKMTLVQILLLFLSKSEMLSSRYMVLGVPLFNVCITFIFHIALQKYLKNKSDSPFARDYVGIVTTHDEAAKIIEDIQSDWTKKIVGIALLDADEDTPAEIEKIPVRAGYEDYLEWIRHESLDEVYVCVTSDTGSSLIPVVREIESMGVTVYVNVPLLSRISQDAYEQELPSHLLNTLQDTAGQPMAVFAATTQDYFGLALKRLMDIVGGLVGCLLAVPITLIVAIPQQIESPGPILFTQNRVGLNGRIFKFYKIRSMYADAETRKKDLIEQNEMNGLMFKIKDDPRITKVGSFIRKTSLDEFPQFFSVLKGDMSLVGTRPPTMDEYEKYQAHHKRRLSMKPGITGLWQVSGRSNIQDFEEIVRLDVSYIDNWSLWLDIKILFRTVYVVLFRRGAE